MSELPLVTHVAKGHLYHNSCCTPLPKLELCILLPKKPISTKLPLPKKPNCALLHYGSCCIFPQARWYFCTSAALQSIHYMKPWAICFVNGMEKVKQSRSCGYPGISKRTHFILNQQFLYKNHIHNIYYRHSTTNL